MKKNKKLFLASIAAMGAVAIGTGAVSTFAWMSATGSATAATTQANNALDVEKVGTASVSNQVIKFTFSNEADVDLIDALATHKTMYVVNGKLYEGTSTNQTGKWTISSVAWDTTAQGYNLDLIKSQFGGKKISIVIGTDGTQSANIKLVTDDGNFTAASSSNLTFAVNCNADTGALTWNETVNSSYLEGEIGSKTPFGYFCVLANEGHNSTTVGGSDTAENAAAYDLKLKGTVSGDWSTI